MTFADDFLPGPQDRKVPYKIDAEHRAKQPLRKRQPTGFRMCLWIREAVSEATDCTRQPIVSERIGSYGSSNEVQSGVTRLVPAPCGGAGTEAATRRLQDAARDAELSEGSHRISRTTRAKALGSALETTIPGLELGDAA